MSFLRTTLVTLAATALLAAPAFAQRLVIKGSDTLGAKLVPQLSEEFKARHSSIAFDIAAEGSTTGIAAVIEGTADIGMSSRAAKTMEKSAASAKGVKLHETIVSHDGLAVILHSTNPITSLTKRQIEQIFTGDITDWSAVGGTPGTISLYTRNTASGTYSDFKDLAMKKRDYAASAQKMAGTEQIAAEVGRNPNAIGYVGLAYIHAEGVKVVAIDGTLPEKTSVQSGAYPYARPNFFYTNGEPKGLAAEFIAFVLSPAGQAVVEQVGFVSVH